MRLHLAFNATNNPPALSLNVGEETDLARAVGIERQPMANTLFEGIEHELCGAVTGLGRLDGEAEGGGA